MQVSKKTIAVPVSATEDLDQYIGRTFSTKKNGQETLVTLEKVKRRDVYLSYTKADRQDRFTETQAKFRKYYCLLKTDKVISEV
ncbi:hypothetical protein D3C87_1221310 [compost metagenome]